MKIEDKEKIINESLNNSKEQLIKNIELLNNSINRNSNEIDMNKLIDTAPPPDSRRMGKAC